MKAAKDKKRSSHCYIKRDDNVVIHINIIGRYSTHINTLNYDPFDNPMPHQELEEIPISEALDALHTAIANLDIEGLLLVGE